MTGKDLAKLLDEHGYDFFTGVPCSLVEALLAELEGRPGARSGRSPYIPAVREDIAVGLAAGAWLGGRTPAVIMQNSGLGTSLNALVSLSLLYRLPALLLVTWRGHGGADAPEHIVMGEISPALLDLIRIPHRTLGAAGAAADLGWARAESLRLSQPVALLVPPGLLETGSHQVSEATKAPIKVGGAPPTGPLPAASISRARALHAAIDALGGEPVVHANGYVCRESFAVRDRPENFYMIGSMGLASSIGLGAALARDDRTVVVFDGDGNLLMNLGILPMIGDSGRQGRPRRFVHIVFDNGVYGSTGGQPSPGQATRLDAVAAAAGYARAICVATARGISDALTEVLRSDGPSFILARVTAEEKPAPRIPYPPEEIRDRFRRALGSAP
jgi:phosphonopyruvate decarboxylase